MGLDLDIGDMFSVDEIKMPLSAEVVRELRHSDLQLLKEGEKLKPVFLKKLGERHHHVARLLAEGLSNAEISLRTGYGTQNIIVLKKDPTFQELVAHYKKQVQDAFTDLQSRLFGVSVDAIDTLRDRLEENPDDVSTGHLVDIAKMGADRSGFGPQSSSTNVNVTMNIADRMDAARKRAQLALEARAGPGPIEDAEIVESA